MKINGNDFILRTARIIWIVEVDSDNYGLSIKNKYVFEEEIVACWSYES